MIESVVDGKDVLSATDRVGGVGDPLPTPLGTARASYAYDPGGRTIELVHWWDDWSGSAYASTPVLASAYQYDAVLWT